jgi:hypothetical protein
MKKTLFTTSRLAALLITVSLIASCGGSSDKPGDTKAASADEAPKGSRFGVKAAICEGKLSMFGQNLDIKIYFDDWGAKTANETNGEMMGTKKMQRNITKDGITYIIDYEAKTAQKTMAQDNEMNFEGMHPDSLKAKGITEIGKETVNGKECTVYELDGSKAKEQSGMDVKGKFWVWKGLPVKMEMGSLMSMELTKITETVPPAEVFEIPADFKITDENTPKAE